MTRWALCALCATLAARSVEAARKEARDWAHMTDADWAKIDEDLEEPEERAEREAAMEKQRKKFEAAKQGAPAGFS